MKYIIEYVAGCKGDLLARFLNGTEESFSKKENNKTNPLDFGGPNWLKLLNPDDLSIEKFTSVLSNNQQQVISSHPIWHIPKNKDYFLILNELGYKIVKIKFSQKHYITIRLESLFKNLSAPDHQTDPDYIVKKYNRLFFDKKNNLNFDHTKHLQKLLSEDIYESKRKYNDQFLLPIYDTHRTVLDYDDLFINFNLSKYEIFQNQNYKQWIDLIEKSWVPPVAVVGDTTYNLEKMGYKNFTIDNLLRI
jgi:hypothetical protein